MADVPPAAPAEDIHALRAAVTVQGNTVRQMKKDGAPSDEVLKAVQKLKALKLAVEKEAAKEEKGEVFNRAALEDLLKRRMFVVPAFEIYGGVAGLYDYGPPACSFKANLVDLWKRHFILEEGMLEIECTTMSSETCLKTSGHVEKFSDLMVKSETTGEYFRADKLLEDHIDNLLKETPTMPQAEQDEHRRVQRQADAYSQEELGEIIKRYGIKAPGSNTELSAPYPFNLMFKTNIGPEDGCTGYLRPETAQGMFVNFRRLLDYNAGQIPMAAAQVGLAFRNEISPRNFLLRVREFQMAEIEHFVNPRDKAHPKFSSIADVPLVLFPNENQMTDGRLVKSTPKEAVVGGVIDNETLAYFMARTQLFALAIGLKADKLRFRQHLSTEMAHYACDCWDLEVETSYGWVECVGHADRACYDLQVHAKKAKVEMVASERFAEPRDVQVAVMKADKGKMGRIFKKQNAAVMALLQDATDTAGSSEEEEAGGSGSRAMELEQELSTNGSVVIGPDAAGDSFTITREMVSWTRKTKRMVERKFVPSVIEPSFGIGRLVYSAFEHNFYLREGDEKRGVMGFAPTMAPLKASVLPLSSHASFPPYVARVQRLLLNAGLPVKVDSSSATIGRRYARADELGTPFAITVDFTTVSEAEAEGVEADAATVTLRERDSCAQVRLSITDAIACVRAVCAGDMVWADVAAKYPAVQQQEEK